MYDTHSCQYCVSHVYCFSKIFGSYCKLYLQIFLTNKNDIHKIICTILAHAFDRTMDKILVILNSSSIHCILYNNTNFTFNQSQMRLVRDRHWLYNQDPCLHPFSLEQTNIHRRNKMMTNSELWQSRTTKQLRDRDEQFPNVRIITTTKRNKKRNEPNLVCLVFLHSRQS